MAVAPVDLDRVATDGLDLQRVNVLWYRRDVQARFARPLVDANQKRVDLQDVSRHLTSDGFLTQMRSFAESVGPADAPTTSNTPAVCSFEANSGCFRPSDRLAGWDSHPLKIADFHGILVC